MSQSSLPIQVRPARVDDLHQITAVESRAFGATAWESAAFAAELEDNPLARYFVAMAEDGTLLGYVGLWVLSDAVHVVSIAVDPPQQRRGIGELLLQRTLDLAAETGTPVVTLECRPSNEPALRLYRKYGFQTVGRRPRYYVDNREDAIVLTVEEITAPAYRARLDQLRGALERRLAEAGSHAPGPTRDDGPASA